MFNIAPDKKKHFWVGILLGAIFQLISFYLFPQNYLFSILISFISIVGVCYGFELFSLITKRGHYEIMDAVAGIIGGVIGMGIILLVDFIHLGNIPIS